MRATQSVPKTIDSVAAILENYASRGVFRGFSRGPTAGTKAAFKMLWHRDRYFDFLLDTARGTMKIPVVLPEVPKDSEMYRDFQKFIESRHSEDLPEHRRVDNSKARIRCSNRAGDVALTLTVVDGDHEYAARKLINVVHEVYLVFLADGPYYEYQVETFDLDPDKM